jgi:chromosome segregation ATPase
MPVPPHVKADIQAVVQRISPSVKLAWQAAVVEMENAMTQKCTWYEGFLNAAIQERETGRKELQKLWDENQSLFNDRTAAESLNSTLQKQCAELEMDKTALRALVDKVSTDNARLTKELDDLRAKQNVEAHEIAETVRSTLQDDYQRNIAAGEIYGFVVYAPDLMYWFFFLFAYHSCR